jgi:pimeloyl-[acyl-carrier protein] methyl ester esterase
MPLGLSVILLPGLDGTGRLFHPLLKDLSNDLQAKVLSYPTDAMLDYAALEQLVEAALPKHLPFIIVAESFSGPLAIKLAARRVTGLIGLVLVGTFVRYRIPLPRVIVTTYLLRLALSPLFLRHFLAGTDAPNILISETLAAIRLVSPSVLVERARQALTIDVTAEFLRCSVPMLYLQGARDRLIGARIVSDLQRLRTDLACIPLDAPHFVLQRRPAEAARAIEHFGRNCLDASASRR